MIKSINRLLCFIAAFIMTLSLNAQQGNSYDITGKVFNANDKPLPGVLVKSGNSNETFTNENGEFNITLDQSKELVVMLASYKTQRIKVDNVLDVLNVVLQEEKAFMGEEYKINIPFDKIEQRRVVGALSSIDIEEHLENDQRIGLGAATTGKVGGIFGGSNVLGLGNAVYIVDGIPRDPSLVNLMEVEEITVLKDAVSKVLYGSDAQNGVILVTTKRGKVNQKDLTVRAEYGILQPRRLPKYLNTPQYMQVLTDANIGAFTTEDIANAQQAGANSLEYPNIDFYGDTFLKDNTNYFDVNVNATGGNENAKYMMNLGYSTNEGWLNLGEKEVSNRINFRGNTDYKLSDNLSVHLDAVAVFDFFKSPDVFDGGNFWTKAETTLPNAYPLLIPISALDESTVFDNQSLIDGQFLLGGSNLFQDNIYGDLTRKGVKRFSDKYFQVNTGIDWDLGFITKGLTFKTNITFDFFNTSVSNENRDYAVYEPVFDETTQTYTVTKIGQDVLTNERVVDNNEAYFSRRLGLFSTLNYKANFGDDKLDVTALGYFTEFALPDTFQNPKNLNFGLRANYMINDRYIAEFSGLMVGTRKLPEGERFAFSPTFGLGWVLSEEDFFKTHRKSTPYLKLKASVGLINNDNWGNNHFLYETSFSTGGWFNYGNGNFRNRQLNYNNVGGAIDWQKTLQVNIGLEGMFFENSLYADVNYFRVNDKDLITQLNNSTPDLLGYTITDNFNAFVDSGFEYTLKFKKQISEELRIEVGHSAIVSGGKVDKLDEPTYASDAQQRIQTGESRYARFGYTADGLYGPSDFNVDGSLVSSLPTPTFGAVQPGDIKYIDINGDGVIDVDDQSIIGSNRAYLQYNFDFKVSYKNFDFYMLGIGQKGQDLLRNNSYFWSFGNSKLSEAYLDAYSSSNPNVNASMPRLSATNNSNNYRNSTFWQYRNDYFIIPTMQLSYNIDTANSKVFNGLRVFVKGNNLINFNKNKNLSELRIGSAPITNGFSFGVVSSF